MPKTFYPNNIRNILLNEIYKKLTDKMAGKINPPQSPSEELNLLYAIWEVIDSLTNGATTNIVTGKTYLQISADKAANKLIPGAFYLIPDYRTYQFIPGTDVLNTSSAEYVSTLEPLIVFALSTNQFAPDAYSLLYPTDHIIYDFDATTETSTGPMPVTKTDKPGSITRRISENGLDAPYDWRACLFRRAKVTDLNHENATWDGLKYNVNISPNILPVVLSEAQQFLIKFTNINTLANPTIIITDGTTTYAATLLKTTDRLNFGVGNIAANTYAYITYETATNSFILSNITDPYSFLDEIKSDYWSHSLSSTLYIGNGLVYTINTLNFKDYYTFDNNNGGSCRNIKIEKYIDGLGIQRYNNIVIKGSNTKTYDVYFASDCHDITLAGASGANGLNNVNFYNGTYNHIHTGPLKDSNINNSIYYNASGPSANCISIGSSSFNMGGFAYNITVFSYYLGDVICNMGTCAYTTIIGEFAGSYNDIRGCFLSHAQWSNNSMYGFLYNKYVIGPYPPNSLGDCVILSRSSTTEVINYTGSNILLSI